MVFGVLCPCVKVRPCVKVLHILGRIGTRKFVLFYHCSLIILCCYYSCTIRSILKGVAGGQRPGSVFQGFCCLVVGVGFGFVLGFFKFLFPSSTQERFTGQTAHWGKSVGLPLMAHSLRTSSLQVREILIWAPLASMQYEKRDSDTLVEYFFDGKANKA